MTFLNTGLSAEIKKRPAYGDLILGIRICQKSDNNLYFKYKRVNVIFFKQMFNSYTETITAKLNRKLDVIRNSPDNDFWLEIQDYLNLMDSHYLLQGCVSSLKSELKLRSQELSKIEGVALKQLDAVKEYLESLKINSEKAKKYLSEYSDFKAKTSESSQPLVFALSSKLYEVIREIDKNFDKSLIEKYVDRDSTGEILRIKLSKAADEYKKMFEKFELDDRIRVSSSYNRLDEFRKLDEEKLKEISAKSPFGALNYAGALAEKKKLILDPEFRSNFFIRKNFQLDLYRVHNYILDCIDFQSLGLSLVQRFKNLVEWYQKNEYLKICRSKANIGKQETELTKSLNIFLFNNGIFPISQAMFGNRKPDILGLHPHETIVTEVKILRKKDQIYFSKGLNQIFDYVGTLNQRSGFLVLFNLTDYQLNLEDKLVFKNRIIYIITVNLRIQPSKAKLKVWDIPKLPELLTNA